VITNYTKETELQQIALMELRAASGNIMYTKKLGQMVERRLKSCWVPEFCLVGLAEDFCLDGSGVNVGTIDKAGGAER
jgi:hypothetical protein